MGVTAKDYYTVSKFFNGKSKVLGKEVDLIMNNKNIAVSNAREEILLDGFIPEFIQRRDKQRKLIKLQEGVRTNISITKDIRPEFIKRRERELITKRNNLVTFPS